MNLDDPSYTAYVLPLQAYPVPTPRPFLYFALAIVFVLSQCFLFDLPALAGKREPKKKKEKDPFAASTGGVFLYSKDAEVKLGLEVKEEVLKQYKIYDDSALTSYIRQVGAKLAAYADRQNVTYEFYVLDDPLVNAFALPGGPIYITRGILTIFNDEAELAGVLGHEIGHVVERHSMKHMQGQQAAGLLLQVLAKGQDVPLWQQLAADLLVFKPYGRGDELRSDALGVKYAYQAGYQADRVANVFEEFQKREEFHIPAFLRSHPVDAKRIEQIRGLWDLIQTRPDIKPGDQPLRTNAELYAKIVGPHTYRVNFPQAQVAFEQMLEAVGRKDLEGVMKVVDKEFKSKWRDLDREGLRKFYEAKFASVDKISDTASFSGFRFLDKDAMSALCTVHETRVFSDGRTENESTAQVAYFKKRAEKETDGPPWRLARLEAESKW